MKKKHSIIPSWNVKFVLNGQKRFKKKGKYSKWSIVIMSVTTLLSIQLRAQEAKIDTLTNKKIELNEVVVMASRATTNTPITFSKLNKREISKVNLGQNMPAILNYLPSVVSTSFDGAGVGNTDFRIRGADNSRINVTINGIPYNDADSQTSFFVNLQDFVSSVENIQIQRGVGTSTNGAGAFGASINILTDRLSKKPFSEISNSFGSFNTRKHTVKFGTGLLNEHLSFSGRLSRIKSDGYVDRAFSDLSSYFLNGVYKNKNTQIKLLVFGGKEITGLSFAGLDAEGLRNDRQFNNEGLYIDRNGVQRFYDRQTDNYNQNHYQLHFSQNINENWSGNVSLHYTKGRGFYEQYVDDANLSFYRLEEFDSDGETVTNSDLITRQHLNSDFYGTVFSLIYKSPQIDAVFGGGWNQYNGQQFGEVTGSEFAIVPNIPNRFYKNESDKKDFNIYAKGTFDLSNQLSVFGDVQIRRISYDASGTLFEPGSILDVEQKYTFFNPKAGFTYRVNSNNKLYFSFARAHREPARVDFENGNPKPEKLNDFELGWRHFHSAIQVNTNIYYLDYRNQLVLTGALDEVGFPIRQNSGSSYRLGIEIEADWKINNKFNIKPNIALSTNKNRDYFIEENGELQNLGSTNISFSPQIIAGNILTYRPNKNWNFGFYSKYVGRQFMANIDSPGSTLDSYFVNDLNIQYTMGKLPFVKSITFSGQINNIFDVKYSNNGLFNLTHNEAGNSQETVRYYPQAGINFLVGMTIRI